MGVEEEDGDGDVVVATGVGVTSGLGNGVAVGVQRGDAEEEAGGWCSAPAGDDYLQARAL